jgi:hypothetical protein
MHTSRASGRPTTSPSVDVASPNPIADQKLTPVIEPIMNTSPWAKLISSMIPYTSVYPIAMSAQIAPFEMPRTMFVPR